MNQHANTVMLYRPFKPNFKQSLFYFIFFYSVLLHFQDYFTHTEIKNVRLVKTGVPPDATVQAELRF